jgi:uracil-DNA glycosylase
VADLIKTVGPHPSWDKAPFWNTYFKEVLPKLEAELARGHTVLPPQPDWFNCFQLGIDDIKVVLIGQDPYPNEGDAHGYAFSVQPHRPLTGSLRNLFKEYQNDLGYQAPPSGDLRGWASRGVFLFNTALTVRRGQAGSHLEIWERFTYEVLSYLSRKRKGLVWLLLGNKAQEYRALIDTTKHCVIAAGHPSPLNRTKPFLGSKVFSKACAYLKCTPEELWKL